jgi:glutaredoxin
MYTRSAFVCPYVRIAERVIQKHNIAYIEVDIDQDHIAKQRVLDWTGFLSVPTFVIADHDSVLPIEEPEALMDDVSPRGVDRGSIITEPSGKQLEMWLEKHGLLTIPSMATSSS